jgi:nucleoside-diphosphate-sugar epimerase
MKILITGLSGFIGGYLNKRFNSKYEIYDLGCNLLEFDKVKDRLHEVNPDFIIHLAARTEVEKSFYEQTTFSQINYTGTVNLIESSKNLSNLKLCIFSSTMETYGWQPESDLIKDHMLVDIPVFNEETQQNPNAPYAVAKMACELYFNYAKRAYNYPFCAIRQTNSYGRVDNDFFVVEQIITQMLKNPNEINLGYKDPYRNFLFIEDLVDMYEAILDKHVEARGEIFCAGPNNALSIEQLVDTIAKKLDWKGKINWDTKPARPGEIYVLNSTNDKATAMLGWSPKTSLSDGLDKTIEIWRAKYTM